MSKYYSKLAVQAVPYTPGEQPSDKKYIKLNTNESPYSPSPMAISAIQEEAAKLNLYSDPEAKVLVSALAEQYNVKAENVFAGNGSDEVLAFAFAAFFAGKAVLCPDVTYNFYFTFARYFEAEFIEVPIKDDFSVDIRDYRWANYRDNHPGSVYGGIVLANPNPPSGHYLELAEIEKLVDANRDGVVLIDEAYIDYGGETAASLIGKYDNLLVVQTLSKSRSLAGLRIGFAIGNEALIEGMNRIKNSYNSYTVDRLAMYGGAAAVKDKQYFEETRNRIIQTRDALSSKLVQAGFTLTNSKGNFIFVSHPDFSAEYLYDRLKEAGILTRYYKQPRINNYLRVSIGSEEEMDIFYNTIMQLVSK